MAKKPRPRVPNDQVEGTKSLLKPLEVASKLRGQSLALGLDAITGKNSDQFEESLKKRSEYLEALDLDTLPNEQVALLREGTSQLLDEVTAMATASSSMLERFKGYGITENSSPDEIRDVANGVIASLEESTATGTDVAINSNKELMAFIEASRDPVSVAQANAIELLSWAEAVGKLEQALPLLAQHATDMQKRAAGLAREIEVYQAELDGRYTGAQQASALATAQHNLAILRNTAEVDELQGNRLIREAILGTQLTTAEADRQRTGAVIEGTQELTTEAEVAETNLRSRSGIVRAGEADLRLDLSAAALEKILADPEFVARLKEKKTKTLRQTLLNEADQQAREAARNSPQRRMIIRGGIGLAAVGVAVFVVAVVNDDEPTQDRGLRSSEGRSSVDTTDLAALLSPRADVPSTEVARDDFAVLPVTHSVTYVATGRNVAELA